MRGASIVGIFCLLLVGGCSRPATRIALEPVFFPGPPETPRLQYLTHLSSSRQVTRPPGAFASLVLGREDVSDEIVKPYGVAIHDGVVYVCDTKRRLLNLFDLKRQRFGYLGFRGRGKLLKPINVHVDDRSFKFVADAERGEIVVFDGGDTYVGAVGGGELDRPVDVTIFADEIFVCDAGTSEIVVFGRDDFRYRRRFGGKGSGEGEFGRPTNIAVDRDGNLYVSDTINGRARKCDRDGNTLLTFGRIGDRLGDFARPKGVAVDREGRVYVVDAAFENVQIFDPDGRLLLFFPESGEGPGGLVLPAQVVIDYENVAYFEKFAAEGFHLEYVVLVSSQYGPRKVSVYGFGGSGGAQ